MVTKPKVWRQFEEAVAALLQALDPTATVRHDVRTPDKDTGRPRQRDVWIETPVFGGQHKLVVLVSCKHKKARLSQQDIDEFFGELHRSHAAIGMIYSANGFSGAAIAKGKALGIACCTLLANQPATLPNSLSLLAYSYRETTRIESDTAALHLFPRLLGEEVEIEGRIASRLRHLVDAYEAEGRRAMAARRNGSRDIWAVEMSVPEADWHPALGLRLRSGWKVYRARAEACLLNGSYSFTTEAFAGSLSTPWMDQHSAHPGPGWELIDESEVDENRLRLVMYAFGGGELEEGLRDYLTGIDQREPA